MFSRKMTKLRIVLVLGIIVRVGSVACAIPVPVANPSFEADIIADGSSIGGAAPPQGWWGTLVYMEVLNPIGDGSSNFTGGVPDGENVLVLYSGSSVTSFIAQNIEQNVQEGWLYNLRMKVGFGAYGYGPYQYRISLGLRDDAVVQSMTADAVEVAYAAGITEGNWTDISIDYTVTAADIGKDIFIELYTHNEAFAVFDDVQFNRVPEPATLLLLGLGSLALLRKRRR